MWQYGETMEVKFTEKIIDELGFEKADMSHYKEQMRDTLKGSCPIDHQKQACLAALIQRDIAEPIGKQLARVSSDANRYSHLANEPHKLLVAIIKDLENEVLEPALDHIGQILNKAAGEKIIIKENGQRVCLGHNAAAMLLEGKRIETSRDAECFVIDEGLEEERIDVNDYQLWASFSTIYDGLTTGLAESGLTLKFILDNFKNLPQESLKTLSDVIRENGKNFIQSLSSQPLDPGAKFRDFITTNIKNNPIKNIAAQVENCSYDNRIIGLTNNSIGIINEKLEEFINLFKTNSKKEIEEHQQVLKTTNENLEKLDKELSELKALQESPERLREKCRQSVQASITYPVLLQRGLVDAVVQKTFEQTIIRMPLKLSLLEKQINYLQMQKVGVEDYLKRKNEKIVYKCPAAYSRIKFFDETTNKEKQVSIVEACYKLVSEKFIAALSLNERVPSNNTTLSLNLDSKIL